MIIQLLMRLFDYPTDAKRKQAQWRKDSAQ